jgi:hypothetical protein
MRPYLNAIVVACLTCAALAAARPAEARHGWRGGIYVGVGPFYPSYWPGYYGRSDYGPGYYGGYYGSSYFGWPYYAAPSVVVAAPPTVYIERAHSVPALAPVAAAATPPGGFWYWCAESRAYYPSVPSCASAWVPVAPR